MNVNVTGPYIYFYIPIFGGIPITQTTVSVLAVTLLLGVVGVRLGKHLKKRPEGKQILVEKGVVMLCNMVCETMGQHNARWVSYIGTIFLSSICGTLIGLTGFLRSSTADLSVPLTWSVMTSVIIWYQNIRRNGLSGWLKGFAEPVAVMTPMNIISEIAQPISMAFRHFGNVAGGGVITMILYNALALLSTLVLKAFSETIAISVLCLVLGAFLLIWGRKKQKTGRKVFGIVCLVLGTMGLLHFLGILSDVPILQFGIPAVLSVYFDLFSGFVQAFVFSLLSMVYIAGACPPERIEDPA